MTSHWQKMQQLRLRYSQELQQQQQQQHQQLRRVLQPRLGGATALASPPTVDSPVARIRNPLLDPTVDLHHLHCRRPCQHRCPTATTREQETKAMLQSRLQRFFNSLPTCGPPPSLLPEPMRRPSVDVAANNNSSNNSSLLTASQRAAPPTSRAAAAAAAVAAADATLAESSCCCSTSNSLEHVTSNEDLSAVTPTSVPSPSPSPPMMVLPPTAPQRRCHPAVVPQMLPQQTQNPQQQAQHPKSLQNPFQPSAAKNPQTPQHPCRQSHWRPRSSSLTQLTHNRRSLLVSGSSQQYLHRLHQQQNQHQHQQQKQQQQQHDYVSFGSTRERHSMPLAFKQRSASAGHRQHQQPLQLPLRESQSAPPVPKPRSQQQQQQHRRRVVPPAPGGSGEATASRPTCQVFHVTDVESVHASLISREDRRVLKILGQFDCRAEVLDTVAIATKRRASIVYVAGPDVQHLNWCLDRIQDLFPAWELKGQMRGSCRTVR